MKKLNLALSLGLVALSTQSFAITPEVTDTPIYGNQRGDLFEMKFSPDFQYRTVEAEVNGQKIAFVAYENLVYVKKPLAPAYQSMKLYIPKAYFEGGEINGFNAKTAPIFMPNAVGGYLPAKPAAYDDKGFGAQGDKPNAILSALAKGYVVASVGARGRTLQQDGQYIGKAPAAIVDLKAAVRYLHFNDKLMPGDANKIISNGTSAGGALSALLGAAGKSADYADALREAGAVEASEQIFAVSAYCPIANLEHADSAYEWEFNGVNQYQRVDMSKLNAQSYNDRSKAMQMATVKGNLSAAEIAVSDELKATFPAYLNSLNLRDAQGNPLTLDSNGDGSFKDYLAAAVLRGAQKAQAAGVDLRNVAYLQWQDNQISGLNWQGYVHSAKRMKSPPAFDALDLSSGENNLFGDGTVNNRHFTSFSQQHSSLDGQMADAKVIKMMNPMSYLAQSPTRYWRIRAGSMDRDTSHAISAILAVKLGMAGKSVDYAIPWGVGHGGDYDLDELFQWTDAITK